MSERSASTSGGEGPGRGDDLSRNGHFIRILIADDHALVRHGLQMILDTEPDMKVVGEAPDGARALELAVQLRPDVVLADVSMPPPDGIELARRLRVAVPEVKTLIVSMHADRSLAREALAAGAAGYVTKMAAGPELIEAIHAVAKGQRYVDPSLGI